MNLSTQTLTSGPDLVTYLNTPIHNGLFGNFKGFSSAYQAIDFSVLEENYVNVDKHIQGVCKGHYLSVIVNMRLDLLKMRSILKRLPSVNFLNT